MQTGTVKWFNSTKGYGFVTPDGGGRDLFVHYTDIQATGYRNLEQGQKVEYEYCEGPKGPAAKNISIAGQSSSEVAGRESKEAATAGE